ncbi:MAG TPA: sodium:proton antiporter [Spirochaetota bacterium]|nr:sodium:proton antiporter [Spirochaetota bacterium]HOD16002.1 sodium:proton antiporter [Spirochaetota bacterium]HPG51260.1 sodium:proton antiporter [Spirochaetota bacterium]HPN12361.1 sodium:proton antiporter [Spirochaetota bacterium]HQL81677.1 sodium:proton antiporter [Spirochaetota bacterium]
MKKLFAIARYASIMLFMSGACLMANEKAAEAAAAPPDISVFWVLPFIGILLCIAIIPLINAHFWEKNLWWISLGVFCVPMAVIFTVFMGEQLRELSFEKALDYVSFIILLASLFVISGGILIKGSLAGTPKVNAIFLLIGSLIASFIGTTGASMLLVRPLIRANKDRVRKSHVIIFFIFLVSNIGGSLTPLGDPPLFLGYLQGVPFEWTFRLIPQWAIACAIVLVIFFIFDTIMYRKENLPAQQAVSGEKFGIEGKINLVLITGVVLIVFFQGLLIKQVSWWPRFGPQEGGMALLLILSLILTPYKSDLRQRNGFTFAPIKEVAYLFAGIFAAMIPALYILEHKGAALGITQPWQFFWAAGSLSSFLDNAPTYLTFLSLAKGLNLSRDIILNDGGHVSTMVLTAISCGAVFMGANSYIGNGPNFMVKSIAEEQGVKMPSFFGYMVYSIAILIPTFILITFIFFM